jgi:hypothetical protein
LQIYSDGTTGQIAGNVNVTGAGSFNPSLAGVVPVTLTGSYTASGDVKLLAFERAGGAIAGAITYADVDGSIEIGTTTSHALKLTTADTTRMTITAAGNVGIGATSPSWNLEVDGRALIADTTARLPFSVSRAGGGAVTNGATIVSGAVAYFNGNIAASDALRIGSMDNGTGAYYIDVSNYNATAAYDLVLQPYLGNVGIGTSSPTQTLHIKGETSANIVFEDTTSGVAGFIGPSANNQSDTTATRLGIRGEAGISFSVGAATKATIDSSGNLLVGKTAQSVDTVGGEILSTGIGQFTVNGNFAGRFTRQTSDGDIVVFRKGTGTVGSIGSKVGNLTIGNGDTGLYFAAGADSIYPYNTSTQADRDAAVDLGYSTVRFKNLYLSGGVYLGGTGAANHLDDYEEGTWVPVSPTVTFTSNVGTYTKVGNRIFVDCSFVVPSTASGVSFYIDNLPFTSSSSSAGAGFYMRYTDDSTFRMFFMLSSGTRVQAYNLGGGGTTLAEVSGHRFDFSGTYFTA